ncbi:MAG TPA: CBS domain-containing protein [Candidatus Limnocylindria bacterium]|nr:CBS domain-containing protein [Candidatus Limnocylindria bacterium]
MTCPVCRFGNFPGDDTCANCGADLWSADTPQQVTTFRGALLGLHLDELGAPEPEMIDIGAGVDEAVARMQAGSIDCLLVTDQGALVGIFTDRDAILKVAGRDTEGLTVGEVMTHDPVILRSGDPVAVAIHKMAVGGFRHVPIVKGGKPVGVVSARDVFKHLVAGTE